MTLAEQIRAYQYNYMMNVTARGFSKIAAGYMQQETPQPPQPPHPVIEYKGWENCTWTIDEEHSNSRYLEEFKNLLQTQHPIPKYNVKSLNNEIAVWGYVSVWNRFDPTTVPPIKDGFENIIREVRFDVDSIRFPFFVYKDNQQIDRAVMYATAVKV